MNKSLEAQFNIRNNTLELQEYLRELQSWEKNVKKADEKLLRSVRHSDRTSAGDNVIPEPRGRAASKPVGAAPAHLQNISERFRNPLGEDSQKSSSQRRPGAREEQPSRNAAGHTYDSYRERWEKFDFEAALAEADGEDPGRSASNVQVNAEAPVPDELPPVRRPLDAEGWRAKGNEWFKLGDHRQAKECYTSSIEAEPSHLGYANRAMACLKLGEHEQAERDATEAISLEPRYLKSWQRRAAARQELGRLPEACADFEMAARLNPGSAAIRDEFHRCFARVAADRGLRPLRRRVSVAVRAAPPEPPTTSASAPSDGTPTGRENVGEARVQARPAGGPDGASGVRERVSAAAAKAARRVGRPGGALPPPKTATEFEKAWKSLGGDDEARSAYLRQIDPGTLPALLKTSLTGPLLGSLAKAALHSAAEADGGLGRALAVLEGLQRVPRFDMALMLLPRADKEALKAALAGLAGSALPGGDARPRLEAVASNWRL